jgi:hypothetical protein
VVVIPLCLNTNTNFPSNTTIHFYCNLCSCVAVKMNSCVTWNDVHFSKVMLLQPESFHTSSDTILSLFHPPYILITYKVILILLFHVILVHSSGCFSRHFPTKILYSFFASLYLRQMGGIPFIFLI